MEKHTAHHRLDRVKELVSRGRFRATISAQQGADLMGFEFEEIPEVVGSLRRSDFYKSMTAHHDHQTWQDVYRPETHRGRVYLKLVVLDDVVIVSFKEL